MKIAFIGLGAMGAPMAQNLVAAHEHVTVFNRTSERIDPLIAAGAHAADSPRAAAAAADVVCTCVSHPEALRAVLFGSDGALEGAAPGTLFVDFSTVDPETSRTIEQACRAVACAFVEAPVSGGVGGAAAGTLTIMVGGEDDAYERALPVLDVVGKQITHVGPVGAGSTIKLINQMLVGINLAGVLEAFILGRLAGIEPDTLYQLLSQSSGNSRMLNRALPGNLLPRTFQPGFSLALLLKDLNLALGLGEDLAVALPMTNAARAIFREGEAAGVQNMDMTAAVLPMEHRYGVVISGREEA